MVSAQSTPNTEWQNLSAAQTAQVLNWEDKPKSSMLCKGYYVDPVFQVPPGVSAQEALIDSGPALLRLGAPSILTKHITVWQEGRELKGDRAVVVTNKDNKLETVTVTGNVHMRMPGVSIIGKEAKVNVPDKLASIEDTVFRYQITPQARESVYNAQRQLVSVHVSGTNYRGTAQKVAEVARKNVTFSDVFFTSCNPYSKAWTLKASELNLDQDAGIGTSYNTFLYIEGVPILYAPYFRFPIDNRRRSGFLFPSLQTSSISGVMVGAPFYWNMAPNYDMVITPKYYSLRGMQYQDLFRYLTTRSSGQVYLSALPSDKVFANFQNSAANTVNYPDATPQQRAKLLNSSDDRYQFAWIDSSRYSPNWNSDVNVDYVNDDNYLQDFGDAPFVNNDIYSNLIPTTQLLQEADLTYAEQHWSVTTQVINAQTLHPINLPPTSDQYARLPEVDLTGNYPNSFLGLDYNLQGQLVDFQHPLFEYNIPTTLPLVTGYRYNAIPSIDLYRAQAWGYINPKISFDQTFYTLTSPDSSVNQQNNMERGVPIYDIDTGLYFDRNLSFGKSAYTQTIEPRLFYLYVPYVAQNQYPDFDASVNPAISYSQLFSTNRFNGFDRIGDANQVTLGFTTRFVQNATGNDVFDASIGEIYYFQNRQVELPNPLTQSSDLAQVSPLVGQATWQFRQNWNATGNFAYDAIDHWLQNSTASINYYQDNSHIFTTSYSYVKNGDPTTTDRGADLSQAGVSTAWAFDTNWQVLAGVNYNLTHKYAQTYLYGFEYDTCCWAARVVDSEQYLGFKSDGVTPFYDNQVSVEFSLRGLVASGWGSNTAMLQYTIPGYQDTFGRQGLLDT